MNIPPKTTTKKNHKRQNNTDNYNINKTITSQKRKSKKEQKQKQKLTPISNLIGGNSMIFICKRSRTPYSPLERPLFYVPFPPSPPLTKKTSSFQKVHTSLMRFFLAHFHIKSFTMVVTLFFVPANFACGL